MGCRCGPVRRSRLRVRQSTSRSVSSRVNPRSVEKRLMREMSVKSLSSGKLQKRLNFVTPVAKTSRKAAVELHPELLNAPERLHAGEVEAQHGIFAKAFVMPAPVNGKPSEVPQTVPEERLERGKIFCASRAGSRMRSVLSTWILPRLAIPHGLDSGVRDSRDESISGSLVDQ